MDRQTRIGGTISDIELLRDGQPREWFQLEGMRDDVWWKVHYVNITEGVFGQRVADESTGDAAMPIDQYTSRLKKKDPDSDAQFVFTETPTPNTPTKPIEHDWTKWLKPPAEGE